MAKPIVDCVADNGWSEGHVDIGRHQSAVDVEQSGVSGTVQSPGDLRFLSNGRAIASPLDDLFICATAVGGAGAAQGTISGRQREKHVIRSIVSKIENTRPTAAAGIGDPRFDGD